MMQVIIDKKVFSILYDFYAISHRIHVTLSYEECMRKVSRMERSMIAFAQYAEIINKIPYRRDWQESGYKEYVTENFHFAYKVYELPTGEKVLIYHDAVHSTLNYNPEDK